MVATYTSSALYPRNEVATAQAPYDDEAWTRIGFLGNGNASYNSLTDTTFDNNQHANLLLSSSYGFVIEAGGTILGIQVAMQKWCTAGSTSDGLVRLLDALALVGSERTMATTALWPGTATISQYGSPGDLWGYAWTPAKINNAGFGVALSPYAWQNNTDTLIGYVTVTVTYIGADVVPSGIIRKNQAIIVGF